MTEPECDFNPPITTISPSLRHNIRPTVYSKSARPTLVSNPCVTGAGYETPLLRGGAATYLLQLSTPDFLLQLPRSTCQG
jgi:hypothetical protein